MHPLSRRLFTEEEYLLIERAAEYKSEYLDGEMFAMSGASTDHARITLNIGSSLLGQFRGRSCDVYTNDVRVKVADSGLYTYPDVMALCGNGQMLDQRNDTLLNPQLIVEVLSPSTASYDRGEKGERYRQLESLTDYLLVAQEQMWVRHWRRQGGHTWTVTEYDQPSDRVRIETLDAELNLAEVYVRVVFPPRVITPPR